MAKLSEAAKAAKREYQRKWRERNKEHVKAYQRKWAKENPEKVKEHAAKHWEKKANVTDNETSNVTSNETSNTATQRPVNNQTEAKQTSNETSICAVCGNEFKPKKQGAMYCTSKCKQKAYRQKKNTKQ